MCREHVLEMRIDVYVTLAGISVAWLNNEPNVVLSEHQGAAARPKSLPRPVDYRWSPGKDPFTAQITVVVLHRRSST